MWELCFSSKWCTKLKRRRMFKRARISPSSLPFTKGKAHSKEPFTSRPISTSRTTRIILIQRWKTDCSWKFRAVWCARSCWQEQTKCLALWTILGSSAPSCQLMAGLCFLLLSVFHSSPREFWSRPQPLSPSIATQAVSSTSTGTSRISTHLTTFRRKSERQSRCSLQVT